MNFNIIFNKRRGPSRGGCWGRAALLALACLVGRPASAEEVLWSTKDLLRDFFKSSTKVSFTELQTANHAAALRSALGYVPPKSKYVVFVATTGDRVDGYAVIDEEIGQHLPITFGVKISPAGEVERVEVMVYRESFGGDVRDERYRQQFVGKTERSPLRAGDDIVAISGATLSSKAVAQGVRRAVALTSRVRALAEATASLDPRHAAP
jgi:hypothetical protein